MAVTPSINLLGAFCCVLAGVVLRWSVAQFPYSGEGKPPKYGDYEAQRHWMEITTELPIEEWYVETADNDLNYWGLDYPPLTAFHSQALGSLMGNLIPESVQLFTSRGFESEDHKFWMRLTVFLSDVLLPSFAVFFLLSDSLSNRKSALPPWAPLLLAVMAPPFILIDYAHFQYNCVSLGLTVLAITCVGKNQMSIASILFTLAVNHKQMSLYHAVPFFVQMVSLTIFRDRRILTAFRVALMIASTMVMLWFPFGDTWVEVLRRIFPIRRGVYEDKVGSFWYVLDRMIPLKQRLPDSTLARLCGISSILMMLPGVVHLFTLGVQKKSKWATVQKAFLLSLFNVSLILFLFSYHVHEKSIMLAVLPMILLLPWYPFKAVWFVTVASLSLYPLLLEEGSHLALISLTVIFVITAYQSGIFSNVTRFKKSMFLGSILGYVCFIIGLHFIPPPPNLPHIYQAGIAILSFIHYAVFSIHFHFEQFQLNAEVPRAAEKEKKKQ